METIGFEGTSVNLIGFPVPTRRTFEMVLFGRGVILETSIFF